tara:strand:+ start:4651 stop:5655 length:1005 start_codon:yes stop_codon:yes gene_type:complete
MSGSSALASARRRRAADPTTQSISIPRNDGSQTSNGVNKQVNKGITNEENSNVEPSTGQTITPLQILQTHGLKIRLIEEQLTDNLEETIVEISKKVLTENLSLLNLDKPTKQSSVSDNNEFKIMSDKLLILTSVSDSLTKSYSKLSIDYNNLSDDNNNLKTMVIRSDTVSLETNNEILKLKTKMEFLEKQVLLLEKVVGDSHENDKKMFNMAGGGTAEMLLRTMMGSGMMGNTESDILNIHDNEEDEDSNEFGDISEITLTESELQDIRSNIACEIDKEIMLTDELIDVSESETETEDLVHTTEIVENVCEPLDCACDKVDDVENKSEKVVVES